MAKKIMNRSGASGALLHAVGDVEVRGYLAVLDDCGTHAVVKLTDDVDKVRRFLARRRSAAIF